MTKTELHNHIQHKVSTNALTSGQSNFMKAALNPFPLPLYTIQWATFPPLSPLTIEKLGPHLNTFSHFCTVQVHYRQTHHTTGTPVAILCTSCIQCGIKIQYGIHGYRSCVSLRPCRLMNAYRSSKCGSCYHYCT